MKYILIIPLLFCTIIQNSQPLLPVPDDFGFKEYTIHPDELWTVQFYVSKQNIKKRKPFSMEVTPEDYNFMYFLEYFKPSKEYEGKLTLEWRVKTSSLVIDYMCNHLQKDSKI